MTAQQLGFALDARDQALAAVTAHSDSQDIAVVDQAILTVAGRGGLFSANDVRPLLPVLRSNNLVGARFRALAGLKRIHRVKGMYVPSNDPGTHAHPIAVWTVA